MFKKILILAPHTDDGEFGCGGAIAKFREEKKEVYYVAFSSAEKSLKPSLPKDTLKKEVRAATLKLGVKPGNLILFDYEVRNFPCYRQQILEDMVKLNKKVHPDLVFLPSAQDTHQDHQVIAQEGFRAFKFSTMLGYEIPWNNLSFTTQAFILLNEKQLNKKISALKCYCSQFDKFYASEDYVRSLARMRGTQLGVKFAEAFQVFRWLIK